MDGKIGTEEALIRNEEIRSWTGAKDITIYKKNKRGFDLAAYENMWMKKILEC